MISRQVSYKMVTGSLNKNRGPTSDVDVILKNFKKNEFNNLNFEFRNEFDEFAFYSISSVMI